MADECQTKISCSVFVDFLTPNVSLVIMVADGGGGGFKTAMWSGEILPCNGMLCIASEFFGVPWLA